jgi:GYF domain 2
VFKVKGIPHHKWFETLLEHKGFVGAQTGIKQPEQDRGGLEWYYSAAGVNIGPVSEKAMVQLIKNNHTIFRNTKVWNSGLPEWKPAEETILTIYFGESSRVAPDGSVTSIRGFLTRLKLLCMKYL